MNNYKESKIMILGSNGYIGSNIKRYLKHKKFFNINAPNSFECNLTKTVSIKNYFTKLDKYPEIIIFSAGMPRNKIFKKIHKKKNDIMILNLLKNIDCKKLNYFIFLSSIDVYNIEDNRKFSENDISYSKYFYGKSKIYCEKILKANISKNKLLILRIPGVFGKLNNSVINLFINNILSRKKIILENHGNNLRDFLFLDDLCKIIYLFIKNKFYGIYNISSGKSYKIKDILDLISKLLNIEYKIINKINTKRNFNVVINNSKFKKKFPKFKFTELKKSIKNII
tara:strand:+ start:1861 stop:2709 length:849 start_codon:yes stop_codon:yes gene_type:complete